MAIAHSEVPEILNLCEVLNHEEVVLVGFSYSISGLAGSG